MKIRNISKTEHYYNKFINKIKYLLNPPVKYREVITWQWIKGYRKCIVQFVPHKDQE